MGAGASGQRPGRGPGVRARRPGHAPVDTDTRPATARAVPRSRQFVTLWNPCHRRRARRRRGGRLRQPSRLPAGWGHRHAGRPWPPGMRQRARRPVSRPGRRARRMPPGPRASCAACSGTSRRSHRRSWHSSSRPSRTRAPSRYPRIGCWMYVRTRFRFSSRRARADGSWFWFTVVESERTQGSEEEASTRPSRPT